MKKSFYLLLILILVFFVAEAKSTFALSIREDIATSSIFSNWLPDGSVQDIVQTPNKIFLAGNFSYFGPYKGNGFLLNLQDKSPVDLQEKINGIVWVAIPDGSGGWYIGGDFTNVGNYPIKKIAHILSNGKVDPNFNLNLNNTVYALAKKSNILYIGGAFTNFNNNEGLNYLLAIDLNTKSLVNNFKIVPDDFIFDLKIDPWRDKLYLAGQFVSLTNLSLNTTSNIEFLAAINLNNNNIATVDENFNFYVDDVVTRLFLTRDYSRLYFSGYFKNVNSLPRKYLSVIDLSSLQVISNFNPQLDYAVLAMTQSKDGGNLYIGGRFRSVGNRMINYLAAINSSTGSVIPTFNCQIANDDQETDMVASVLTLELDLARNILYVGGSFKDVNNQSKPFFFAADVSNNFCQLVDEVNLDMSSFVDGNISDRLNINDRVNTLSLSGNKLFIGGRFFSYGGVFKKYLAAFDKESGRLDTNFNFILDRPAYRLLFEPQTNQLYFVGYFTKVNGFNRNYIASINLSNYSLTNFALTINTTTGEFISDIVSDGNYLYLGGYFKKINNQETNYLAKVNALTGVVDNFFKAEVNNFVNALAVDNNYLYLGGNFTKIANENVNYLAVVDKNSGQLIKTFNANFDGRVNDLEIDRESNLLFVGGSFNQPSRNFVILNAQNGSVVNKDFHPNGAVLLIKRTRLSKTVFVSGYFDNLVGLSQSLKSIFALDYNNGRFTLNPWQLNLNDNSYIYALDIDETNKKIYLGGDFNIFNNENYSNNIALINFEIPLTGDNRSSERYSSGGGGGSGGAGGGGGGGSTAGGSYRPTTTISQDNEALRLFLLQFILQLLSKQETKQPKPSKIKGIPAGFQFTRQLKFGMKGKDVKYLQIFLKAQGKSIYPEGKITGIFGTATRKAVIRFQEKYKKEILTPQKLKKGTGIVDNLTLKKINMMLK